MRLTKLRPSRMRELRDSEQRQLALQVNRFHPDVPVEVERILDRRSIDGRREYLVSFVGFPASESCWLPRTRLRNVQPLLQSFDKEYALFQSLHSRRSARLEDSVSHSESRGDM